jgi:hypothetical protein
MLGTVVSALTLNPCHGILNSTFLLLGEKKGLGDVELCSSRRVGKPQVSSWKGLSDLFTQMANTISHLPGFFHPL